MNFILTGGMIKIMPQISGKSGRRIGDFLLFGVTSAELTLLIFLTPTFTFVDWIYVLQHVMVLAYEC